MWKLILGLVVLAAATLLLLSQGGEIDMGGEKHGAEATQSETAAK